MISTLLEATQTSVEPRGVSVQSDDHWRDQVLNQWFIKEMSSDILDAFYAAPHEFAKHASALRVSYDILGGTLPDTCLEGERFWGNAGPKGLSVLRAFRLLRVVRLLKSFESLQTVLETVKECVKGIMDFSLILVIVIYTFALMGMSFFGDRLCQEWACSLGQFDDRASCVAGVGEWQKPGAGSPQGILASPNDDPAAGGLQDPCCSNRYQASDEGEADPG